MPRIVSACSKCLFLFLFPAVVPAAAQTAPAAPAEVQSVLFMPIQPRNGVNADLCKTLTDALVIHASTDAHFKITSYEEVSNAMSQEQARQMAGCDSASCAAEIAGALNNEQIVFGTLGRVGTYLVLSLSRVRARDAKVRSRVLEQLPADNQDTLLLALPSVAQKLFRDEFNAQLTPATPSQPGAALAPSVPTPPLAVAAPAEAKPEESEGRSSKGVLGYAIGGAGGLGAALGALVGLAGWGGMIAFGAVRGYDAMSGGSVHRVNWIGAMTANAAAVVGFGASVVGVLGLLGGLGVAALGVVLGMVLS